VGVLEATSQQPQEAAAKGIDKHNPACRQSRLNDGLREAIMAIGTVKFFNATKGFGFIQPDGGSKDVFVHVSAVEKAGIGELHEGDKVTFEVEKQRGKPAASNLRRVT